MSFWPLKTNFSLIAENTTKYYMELKGLYKERFADDASLLAAAGVLDAQNYIFPSPPKIDITDVMELARKCTAKDEDYIPMRKLIQYSDNTRRYRDHKSSIADLLSFEYSEGPPECTDEVFDKKYKVGQGILARATTAFMENSSLEPLRNRLGILP